MIEFKCSQLCLFKLSLLSGMTGKSRRSLARKAFYLLNFRANGALHRSKCLLQNSAFVSLFSEMLNVSGRFNSDELSRDMAVGDDIHDEPFFEERSEVKAPQNVSALIGKTAFLTCIVRNLGKAKSVSKSLISKSESSCCRIQGVF